MLLPAVVSMHARQLLAGVACCASAGLILNPPDDTIAVVTQLQLQLHNFNVNIKCRSISLTSTFMVRKKFTQPPGLPNFFRAILLSCGMNPVGVEV